ncbi:hypothetical protein ABZ260_44225, partial [Streptosporangium sp. NPDC006013]|uniref:hypothetical protein n=1 Tax=Streptosporangium sp. NPDC006013 TaxID=3155596 RepID=UPI0033BAEED7
ASGISSSAAGVPDSAFTALFWLGAAAAVLGIAISPLAVRHAAAVAPPPRGPQPAQELQRTDT